MELKRIGNIISSAKHLDARLLYKHARRKIILFYVLVRAVINLIGVFRGQGIVYTEKLRKLHM